MQYVKKSVSCIVITFLQHVCMDSIQEYLLNAWFSKKEIQLYQILYQHGEQPASSLARFSWLERVTTYKLLQWFVEKWLVSQTQRRWVKHFWIPSLDLLQKYVKQKQEKRRSLSDQFDFIKTEFEWLDQMSNTHTPKLRLFEWHTQLQSLFDDMKQTIIDSQLLVIQFFWTNTFQDQLASSETITSTTSAFLDFITKQNIHVETTVAEGWLIMEKLMTYKGRWNVADLPAWNNAINMFVVGKTLYCVIYKHVPIGLKFESPELAWAIWFLLRQVGK